MPCWLWPVDQEVGPGLHTFEEESQSPSGPEVEILPCTKRVGEVKIKSVSTSQEESFEDLMNFKDEDCLHPRLDGPLAAGTSLAEDKVYYHERRVCTNPGDNITGLSCPELESIQPPLESFSTDNIQNMNLNFESVSDNFSPV